MRRTTEQRFKEKIRVMESGCHEWQSTISKNGYGRFWNGKDQSLAHRISYQLNVGEIPETKMVLHKCDNRKCVNPDHLYIGTASDNVRDKVSRFRGKWGNIKIPYDVVEKARSLYFKGLTQQKVADILGIKQVQVSRYIRGHRQHN